jgi:hypothetical protein
MQALSKATLLAVGLLISGSAMAAENLGGWAPYNAQYAYNPPPNNYGTYSAYTSYYSGYPYYPAYNNYGYPIYGWYSGTRYSSPGAYVDPSAPSHPYSRTNPNWVPYAGWR